MGLILADTNMLIYTLKGIPAFQQYISDDFGLSDISVIELLGVKNIDETTFQLRKAVPDAIIAATALHYKIPLLTADKGFAKIKELPAIIISLV